MLLFQNVDASPLELRVLDCIEHPSLTQSEDGISLNDIIVRLSSDDVTSIRGAVDSLLNEANIFTTIDDDHFKSTYIP